MSRIAIIPMGISLSLPYAFCVDIGVAMERVVGHSCFISIMDMIMSKMGMIIQTMMDMMVIAIILVPRPVPMSIPVSISMPGVSVGLRV